MYNFYRIFSFHMWSRDVYFFVPLSSFIFYVKPSAEILSEELCVNTFWGFWRKFLLLRFCLWHKHKTKKIIAYQKHSVAVTQEVEWTAAWYCKWKHDVCILSQTLFLDRANHQNLQHQHNYHHRHNHQLHHQNLNHHHHQQQQQHTGK